MTNPIRVLREEIVATMASDFERLSDVHALICRELGQLQSLHGMLTPHMLDLTQVQELILHRLDELPEWRHHIATALPDLSLEHAKHRASEVFQALQASAALPALPESITRHLHSLPSVREHLASKFTAAGHELTSMVRSNISRMPDVQSLVSDHFHALPVLQQQVALTYASYKPELKTFHATPAYMTDNRYIHTGYRPELMTFYRCFLSLFYVHNETGNIYTHMVGAIAFFSGWLYLENSLLHDHPFMERFVLAAFFMGAFVCLTGSTIFHTCCAHSHSVHRATNKLDYAGISSLIGGSVLPIIYYAHFCHPYLAAGYIMATVLGGVICTAVTFSNKWQSPSEKHIRVLVFIAFALTGLLPVVHFGFMYGPEHLHRAVDLFWVAIVSGPLYLTGAFVYVSRFPECFFPGKFDIWFHSHQLWHLFVLAGAATHFVALHNMFHFRKEHSCSHEEAMWAY